MDDVLSPSTRLLVQLVLILGAARVVGSLFRRLGQPQVIAEMVTGMLMGPTLLGRFWPEWHAVLFPPSSLPALDAISQVGLLLFMFLVGLELDLGVLRRQGRLAASVTIGTLVVPLAAGVALALALHRGFGPPGVPFAQFAFFIAVAMSVTAFPVLARILAERGMLATTVGTIALTAAAGQNLASFVMLGVSASAAHATGATGVTRAVTVTLAYVGAMILLVRPLLARIELRFGTLRDLKQTGLALLLLAVFVSALLAEHVGIHALFGAFLAGVAMPRVHRTVAAIRGRVEDIATLILLPVFFAATGLRTDLMASMSAGKGSWTLAIIAISTGAMWLGALVPALRAGLGFRDGVTLGVLANTRGLMELIILTIGLDLGLLTPTLFAMFVVMAIVNTLATAPLVAWLYPRARVLAETTRATAASTYGLVACVAHPDNAAALGRLAGAICGPPPARGWALRLVSMGEQPGLFPNEPTEAEGPAEILAGVAQGAGSTFEPVTAQAGDVVDAIQNFSRLNRADAILLGLHRPLWGGAQLGGPVAGVAHAAPCDVLVFHDAGFRGARRVVLGLGGDNDEAAKRVADRIASRPGVELVVIDGRSDGGRIDALKAASKGADLVVVGIGAAWDIPLHRFDMREPRLLAEVGTSLLAVCSGEQGD
ncbi:MAG: cation:proton antiporter [Deltaproteobacteria bacterium]|nr:cation:proton antiporter [Deltaproteobacteria bacterium]